MFILVIIIESTITRRNLDRREISISHLADIFLAVAQGTSIEVGSCAERTNLVAL